MHEIIVEVHGVRIWIDKRSYIEGASIVFSLPVNKTTTTNKNIHDRNIAIAITTII
jgi:hypothetical protein